MKQNRIKAAAHDHPRFRSFAARYGQAIHQLNMRLSVALLRNVEAEMRAKELAEAPTVKTKEQVEKEEAAAAAKAAKGQTSDDGASSSKKKSSQQQQPQSVWKRKFRPLPEQKAVSLFADVVGDAFILGVAGGLIIYEYWKALQKPDTTAERIRELQVRIEELRLREEETRGKEEEGRRKVEALEEALRALHDPKTKKPLLPGLQKPPEPTPPTPPTTAAAT
jgi:hypothetical protein